MPFKSENLTYGSPQDPYNKEGINKVTKDLTDILELERQLVGVRFCFTKEDYDHCEVAEIKSATTYCIMVKQAANGKATKSRLEHHKCDGGTTALALEKSTERIESGEEYFSYHLYESNAAARRLRNSIQSLHHYKPITYGMVIQPLMECQEKPDMIIGIINAYQAMRLVQGYEYASGEKPQIDMGAMQGICSEVTASPYLTGKMNVSVLCPSTRTLCKWDTSDMAVGIPFHQYETIVKGVAATNY